MSEFDEFHLRRFLEARRAGDDDRAYDHWSELVTGNFDRIDGFVKTEARKRRLSDAEAGDALSLSLEGALVRLRITFDGESVGEFVNAVRTLVSFRCGDVQQKAIEHRKRTDRLEGTDEYGPSAYERQEARRADEPESAADAEDAEDGLTAYGRDFLAWALPQLKDKRRSVLELQIEGVSDDAIAERLDCSMDVVYQSRKRGKADLARLRDHYEES